MIKRLPALSAINKQILAGFGLVAVGIALACFAQITLMQAQNQPGFWEIDRWLPNLGSNNSPLPGLMLYVISGWIFVRGLGVFGHNPGEFNITTIEIPRYSPRFGFWATSLGLAIFTAIAAAWPNVRDFGSALAVVWLINIALLIFSVLREIRWQMPAWRGFLPWLNAHRLEILGLALLIVAAFFNRFWNVELHPYSFINDEGQMGLNGVCIVQGPCSNLFEIGWSAQPLLSFVPTGISVALLGHTATAVRLVSVITGTLAVLAVYLFTRLVFGQKEAWVAAAVLAVLPVNVHFSRLGVENINDALSTTTILGLLFFGMRRGSTWIYLLAGILGGLCFYTYPGTRLAPLLGLGALGYVALRVPGFLKAQAQNIVIFILALFVTAAPIAGFFTANPNIFFARMDREGIFQNQVFTENLQNGQSPLTILTNQFMRSSLVYILTPAPSNFFDSPNPYLTPLAAIFFMLGLAYVLRHIKQARFLVLFAWFWAAIILGSTLTGGPPSSQRMMMSTPGLAIITSLGLWKALETLPRIGHPGRWLAIACALGFVSWVGFKDVSFYHYEYLRGHYFEDPTNEFTYETAAIISPLHDEGRLYLITEPSVPYLSFPNFQFFSPDVEKNTLENITTQSLADLPKDKDVLFIATPGRLSDLQNLASMLPGGEWNEVPRRNQPTFMLYYSYKIKTAALQKFKP